MFGGGGGADYVMFRVSRADFQNNAHNKALTLCLDIHMITCVLGRGLWKVVGKTCEQHAMSGFLCEPLEVYPRVVIYLV